MILPFSELMKALPDRALNLVRYLIHHHLITWRNISSIHKKLIHKQIMSSTGHFPRMTKKIFTDVLIKDAEENTLTNPNNQQNNRLQYPSDSP